MPYPAELLQSHQPVFVNFTIIAHRIEAMERGRDRLALSLEEVDTGASLGIAWAFPREWYPTGRAIQFSHYYATLRTCFESLNLLNKPSVLKLHILKALNAGTEQDPWIFLLKFVIDPDYSVTGTDIEKVFGCSSQYYYEAFIGVTSSPTAEPSINWLSGTILHAAYQNALQARLASNDQAQMEAAYDAKVLELWRGNFELFARHAPKRRTGGVYKPKVEVTRPLDLKPQVFGVINGGDINLDVDSDDFYFESLIYSAETGLSGRSDRITLNPFEVAEIKTSTFGEISTVNPNDGTRQPGGLQAFSYFDTLSRLRGVQPSARIEVFEQSSEGIAFTPIRLENHALIERLHIDLRTINDQYLDLLIQNRNIAYIIESGLFTGYDRQRISTSIRGRFVKGLWGNFNYSGWAPCRFCPTYHYGICPQADENLLDPDLFLHVPDLLYEFWAGYHSQLRDELVAIKKYLAHLIQSEPNDLYREGISLFDLTVNRVEGNRVEFGYPDRIDTRIRVDDAVLITPGPHLPAQIFSVEGRVEELGYNTITVALRSGPLRVAERYRIDQSQIVYYAQWQIQSISRFLLETMKRTGIIGRILNATELPRLVKILLNIEPPRGIQQPSLPHLANFPLDADKCDAIEKAMGMSLGDILLTQGPPGTGKTQMIAYMAREIFRAHGNNENNRAVLILANTNRAADEIIIKLDSIEDIRPHILRVGNSRDPIVQRHLLKERVHLENKLQSPPDAQNFTDLIRQGFEEFNNIGIIVSTLASIRNQLIKGLNFHYVIVDETGQATEPATLQSLTYRPPDFDSAAPNPDHAFPRLILVGDHRQLPPVVPEGATARPLPPILHHIGLEPHETMRVSLFERLFRLYGHSPNFITLTTQYRYNQTINEVIQRVFYPDIHLHADASVADRSLNVIYRARGITRASTHPIFSPAIPIILIDTEHDERENMPPSGEELEYESRYNEREAQIIARLVRDYLMALEEPHRRAMCEQIGIISPYRRQNNMIRQELARAIPEFAPFIRVDTVDRFQGSEKELIILSLVNNNPDNSIGELHADWRRMNVSISRARSKVIIIGNPVTFTTFSNDTEEEAKRYYRRLFAVIEELATRSLSRIFNSESI